MAGFAAMSIQQVLATVAVIAGLTTLGAMA
jgi:hypothetical protein